MVDDSENKPKPHLGVGTVVVIGSAAATGRLVEAIQHRAMSVNVVCIDAVETGSESDTTKTLGEGEPLVLHCDATGPVTIPMPEPARKPAPFYSKFIRGKHEGGRFGKAQREGRR